MPKPNDDSHPFFTKVNGIEANEQEAFNWASKAAAQGDPEALTLLGTLYLFGKGIPADSQHAVELLTPAANAGDSLTFEMLGATTSHGTGTPKDLPAALQWYTRAAEKGRGNPQCVLGYLYSGGGKSLVVAGGHSRKCCGAG